MIIDFNGKPKGIPLADLIDRIESAGHEELDAIIDALQSRYKQLFPEWEVAFLSVPTGNPEDRKEQAKLLIEFIQRHWLDS